MFSSKDILSGLIQNVSTYIHMYVCIIVMYVCTYHTMYIENGQVANQLYRWPHNVSPSDGSGTEGRYEQAEGSVAPKGRHDFEGC